MNSIRLFYLLFCLSFSAPGALIVDHFDDLSNQPVDGLSHLGIFYSYTFGGSSSPDAIYGLPFPADSLIGATVLAGPANDLSTPSNFGVLTLAFDTPSPVMVFAIALSSSADDSFTLTLTDGLGNVGTPLTVSTTADISCDPVTSVCFSEASYTYTGSASISVARFSFANTQSDAFAIGTLAYESVPETGTWLMLATGLALLVTRRTLLRHSLLTFRRR